MQPGPLSIMCGRSERAANVSAVRNAGQAGG
jgi:hypothetical protein